VNSVTAGPAHPTIFIIGSDTWHGRHRPRDSSSCTRVGVVCSDDHRGPRSSKPDRSVANGAALPSFQPVRHRVRLPAANRASGVLGVPPTAGSSTFGSAKFFGSTGSIKLKQTHRRHASTPDGQGYWLVATDGGIFAFGNAKFFGSTGSIHLNQPIVGMASMPDGQGYLLRGLRRRESSPSGTPIPGLHPVLHLTKPIVWAVCVWV